MARRAPVALTSPVPGCPRGATSWRRKPGRAARRAWKLTQGFCPGAVRRDPVLPRRPSHFGGGKRSNGKFVLSLNGGHMRSPTSQCTQAVFLEAPPR